MEDQKYIYWHPGDEQPECLSGWMWYSGTSREYIKCYEHDNSPLNTENHYRKTVTAEEYRAFHGMKLWHSIYPDSKIQDGYRVIDFRRPDIGELFAYIDGCTGESKGILSAFAPILAKIEPEIVWVTPTQADVINSIKTTGDYPEAVFGGGSIGKLVCVYGEQYMDSTGYSYDHCKMNAALREEWK